MQKYLINSIVNTRGLASRLVKLFVPGSTFFLTGPVGAGKSTLVRLMLNELGIDYRGSPTFGLLNVYDTAYSYKIVHMDLYHKPTNILQEIYGLQDGVLLIEWAANDESIKELFPDPIVIELSLEDGFREAKISTIL